MSVVFIIVSMVRFLIFINVATRYSSFAIAAPIAVIVLPVLITRHEVRPELFSYLFGGLFLQLLWGYKYGKLGSRWLFLLPILELFWVNLHIYFFIGVLIAIYLFEWLVVCLTQKKPQNSREQVKALAIVLSLTVFSACLIQPGSRARCILFSYSTNTACRSLKTFRLGLFCGRVMTFFR